MIEKEILKIFKNEVKSRNTAFIVGAGISIPAPSHIRALPQVDCIKAISDLEQEEVDKLIHTIRPEVFFQVLYNVIGNRALKPLEIINPKFLNSEDTLVSPNSFHFFLANRIRKGQIVITTNFDSLIEEAYEKLTNRKELKLILYEDDFNFVNQNTKSLKSGLLIKFHGSFYDSKGRDSRDTIRFILEQVQIHLFMI